MRSNRSSLVRTLMKYLITGATGNIGSLVTKRLLEAGERPCVLVRDAKKARKLFGDLVEVRVGDLSGPRTELTNLFQGCGALFLVNTGPDLGERDRACALAARDAGVQRLVKLSTLDVKTGVGTGPWHARGEAAIRESGVRHTFIQTAAFMSNALSGRTRSATTGSFPRRPAREKSPSSSLTISPTSSYRF